VARRVAGLDLTAGTPHWLSRHGNVTRLASRYREGRVFLAGDAAHTQPPAGGQGLTAGLHDAANLGWKLAAALNGWAPPGLLDTYHDERHQVGRRVMANARVQNMLMSGGLEAEALRTVFTELVAVADVNRHLAGDLAQLDVRYNVGGDHDLVGRRIPPVSLTTSAGATTTLHALAAARGLLLVLTDEPVLDTLAAPWRDRVDVVPASSSAAELADLAALLVRPDGHVAWVAPADTTLNKDGVDNGGLDKDGLVASLRTWFGDPSAA
jgi:bifunctional hydroxylase/dehydrase